METQTMEWRRRRWNGDADDGMETSGCDGLDFPSLGYFVIVFTLDSIFRLPCIVSIAM